MPYTITRQQRDALHAEATTELAEIGDIYLALENDDFRLARQLRQCYEPLLLLLDEIGWEPQPQDAREVFELVMLGAQVAAVTPTEAARTRARPAARRTGATALANDAPSLFAFASSERR